MKASGHKVHSPVLCLADPTDPSAGPVSGANGAAGAGGGATGGGGTGGNGGTALVGLKSNSRPGGGRHEGSSLPAASAVPAMPPSSGTGGTSAKGGNVVAAPLGGPPCRHAAIFAWRRFLDSPTGHK